MFSYPQPEPISSAYSCEQIERPLSTLGYATNNVYPSFPANMGDSRSLIASYQPEAILNDNLIKQSGVKTNWEYRKYLVDHSKEIAESNFKEACNDCGYFDRFRQNERGEGNLLSNTGLAYKDPSIAQTEQSDLKKLYLSREELSSKHEPQTLTQEQLFSYMSKK
jgi:hypothetical protein